MAYIKSMLENHPQPLAIDLVALDNCIAECADCSQSCTACADACLGESNRDMLVRCIRLNLDCADICNATARILSRQTPADWEAINLLLQACGAACRACSEECDRHAVHHTHCRVCAEACRSCEQACHRMISEIPSVAAV